MAGQCWHWFDGPAAAHEAIRVLKSNGILLIVHCDWIPLPGNLVALTEEMITKNNSDWPSAGEREFIHVGLMTCA